MRHSIYFSFLAIDDNNTKPDHFSINYTDTAMGFVFFLKEVYRATSFTILVNSSFISVGVTHLMFGAEDDLQSVQVYL